MSTCPTMMASQFMCKFPRSNSRSQCTISYAQSLVSWSPACFNTVSQCSTLVPDLFSLRILLAVACFSLKEQRERIMYGTTSAEKRRCVAMSGICSAQFNLVVPILRSRPIFSVSQPISAHHCSTLISHPTSPLVGSADASLNRSPNRSPFPLLPHASSALLFSRPRSKRQSGTWAT
jgi:hypothetical protein